MQSSFPSPSLLQAWAATATLAGMLPEHDPAAAAGGGERRERGLGSDLDLPRASGAPELFDAIGVHGGAGAPVTQIATAGAEGMRTLDADIASVKSEGITALHTVPLKSFQEELAHGGVTIVGVKDVDVLRAEPGTLIHPPGRAVGPVLYLVQVGLGGALSEVMLCMVQHVDRRLLHIPSALGGREEVGCGRVDRPVAVPQPEGIQDIPRGYVVFHGQLRHTMGRVVPPRGQQSVAVLVDHKGGQVIVCAAVFE